MTWIKCTEKLPKENREVLGYMEHIEEFAIAHHNSITGSLVWYQQGFNDFRTCPDEITHWQPLPELPKENEK